MKLSHKILGPLFGLILILSILYAYLLYSLQLTKQEIQKESTVSKQLIDASISLSNLHNKIKTDLLQYMYTGNAESIRFLESDHQQIESQIAIYRNLITNAQQKSMLDKYETLRSQIRQDEQQILQYFQNNDSNAARLLINTWQHKKRYLDALISDIITYNVNHLDRSNIIIEASIRQLIAVGLLITGFSLISLLVLTFFLDRMVTRPIKSLSRYAREIAAGSFKPNAISNQKGDEIGQLGFALNTMTSKLQSYYHHLEEEVKQKTQTLRFKERLEKQKDDFIAMASHELKTPITSQRAFVQLLQKRLKQKSMDDLVPFTEKIEQQTDKLVRLISDLLDVSKIAAGRLVLHKEPFDFSTLLKDTVHEVHQTYHSHKIDYRSNGPILLTADKHRLSQVLNNLIINAIKYSPDANRVVISYGVMNKNLEVNIRDFGIGIDDKHLGKIFKRFYRVNGNNEKTFSGMGIGLNISSEIVKMHGGQIRVKSSLGQGSEFTFTVPLQY